MLHTDVAATARRHMPDINRPIRIVLLHAPTAAAVPLTVLDEAAVLAIARTQADGWRYIRA